MPDTQNPKLGVGPALFQQAPWARTTADDTHGRGKEEIINTREETKLMVELK